MELLKKLTACNSPSGREDEIRSIISDEIKDYCDNIDISPLGNLVARKGNGGKKLIVCAHMDEIGVVVTYKDENGFLRFSPVGGVNPKNILNRRVVFKNGAVGVIGSEPSNDKWEFSKMYIDTGVDCGIEVGDMACFKGCFSENGDAVISKALDNRAGCYVLIEAMKRMKREDCEVYFAFTVQEEVGLRGAKTVAFGLDADYALAVDVTATGDTPECSPMAVSLGKGAAIKIMDRSVICHSEVRDMLINASAEKGIPYQLEILTFGGTDAGAVHMSGTGIKTGAISIPTRCIHSSSEIINKNDLESAVQMLCAFIERM